VELKTRGFVNRCVEANLTSMVVGLTPHDQAIFLVRLKFNPSAYLSPNFRISRITDVMTYFGRLSQFGTLTARQGL
jgi:hypothetical protein